MRKPSTEWHRLSEADRETRWAVCSLCGPVRVRYRANGTPECMTARKGHRKAELANRAVRRLERRRAARTAGCEICGSPDDPVRDHNHECCPRGKWCERCYRGWLCRQCNLGLGYFRDDPAVMLAAIKYIRDRPLPAV